MCISSDTDTRIKHVEDVQNPKKKGVGKYGLIWLDDEDLMRRVVAYVAYDADGENLLQGTVGYISRVGRVGRQGSRVAGEQID